MPRLADKHNNTQSIVFANFSGGLNTTSAQEMLAENELWRCENMDCDTASGLLKVVDGNKRIFTPDGISFRAMLYDKVNETFLLVDAEHKVYEITLLERILDGVIAPVNGIEQRQNEDVLRVIQNPTMSETIGTLTGTEYPVTAQWEDGLLIASGGKLQYYHNHTLTTLDNSPSAVTAVYVRGGRVLCNDRTAGHESNIYYSAAGDEASWEDRSGDDSTGKWLEVGYKDGGKIISFVPMSSDVIILKDNRCVYRLLGEYPDWTISEVSRNVEAIGPLGFYAEGTSVYVLGRGIMQFLDIGQYYGDIKAADVGTKVTDRLLSVPKNPRMIHVPAMRQVWIPLKDRYVLVYDLTLHAFFQRRFSIEDIVDVVCVDSNVFIVKPHGIFITMAHSSYDDNEKVLWRFVSRRLISHNDFLLKRVSANITPWFHIISEGNFKIGGVMLPLPTPYVANRIWHNYSRIYHNRRRLCGDNERTGYNLYEAGDQIYENFEPIYHNYRPIYNPSAIALRTRCVYRNRTLAVQGMGAGSCFVLNALTMDVAEV